MEKMTDKQQVTHVWADDDAAVRSEKLRHIEKIKELVMKNDLHLCAFIKVHDDTVTLSWIGMGDKSDFLELLREMTVKIKELPDDAP